jgi:sugar/nucleoside kinase (ribokinase family)
VTTRDPTVIGVGNALVDHTYLVSNLPEPDGGAYVLEREQRFGGVETNVIVTLEALGVDAGLIARLGTDDDGDAVSQHLAELPIDTRHVRRVLGDESSYTHVLVDPDGRRVILGGGDSTLNLSLDADDRALLSSASVAVTSAYTPVSVLEGLTDIETPIVYDLAGGFDDLERRGLTRSALTTALPEITCFVTNLTAARSYLELPEADAETLARRLRRRGATRGAVTRGREGAVLFDAEETYPVGSVSVEVVDTTGAGDAFTAGLVLAWVLENRPPTVAGRFASAAAAATCRVEGAHVDPPSRETVEALLD